MPERDFTIVDPGKFGVENGGPCVQAKVELKLWNADFLLPYVANSPLGRTELLKLYTAIL